MAYRSREILDQARLSPDLSSAFAGTEWVVGLSGRRQKGEGIESMDALAPEIWERAGRQKITLLFGPEGSGLTNDILSRCHRIAFIPTGPLLSTLNLAQAVLLVAAALLRASRSDPDGKPARDIAPVSEGDPPLQEIEQTLEKIGFLKPSAKKTIPRRVRRIFMRAEVDSEEVKLLRAIFRQMIRAAEQKRG